MKNFVFACVLLLIACILTGQNARAVCLTVDELEALATQDKPQKLCRRLAEQDAFLSLSVNHILLEQIRQKAEDMRFFSIPEDANSVAAYRSARAQVLLLLEEVRAGEKFSFFNIF